MYPTGALYYLPSLIHAQKIIVIPAKKNPIGNPRKNTWKSSLTVVLNNAYDSVKIQNRNENSEKATYENLPMGVHWKNV